MATSNILQGAATGAAAGASTGNPWAALAGGAIGGLTGLFSDDGTAARKQALSDYQTQMQNAMNQYQASQGNVLSDYGDLYSTSGVKGALNTYTNALTSADPTQYQVSQNMGQQSSVDPLSNWQDYLDPSIEYQQESARKNVEESAAGQGGLYSGAAAREIAADVADIASQGYQTALENARQNTLDNNSVATQNLQNAMSAGNYNTNLGQTNLSNLGTAYQTQQNLMDTYSSGMSDLNKTLYSGQTSSANTALQGSLGNSGGSDMWGNLLNASEAAKNVYSMWK